MMSVITMMSCENRTALTYLKKAHAQHGTLSIPELVNCGRAIEAEGRVKDGGLEVFSWDFPGRSPQYCKHLPANIRENVAQGRISVHVCPETDGTL